jgi:alpha-glucosidase
MIGFLPTFLSTLMRPIKYASLALLFAIAALSQLTYAQQLSLKSPDGSLEIRFEQKSLGQPYLAGSRPYYRVLFHDKAILDDSPLGLTFAGFPSVDKDLEVIGHEQSEHNSSWQDSFGTRHDVPDHYREMTVQLKQRSAPSITINVVFRAYDRGVALRYEIPKQVALNEFALSSEQTTFFFPADANAFGLNPGRYNSNYEGNYKPISLGQIQPASIIALPFLVHATPEAWAAILEADLEDYGGMYLGGIPGAPNALISKISPHSDRSDIVASGSLPAKTPWRVILVSGTPGGLIESDYIVLNLNPPSQIHDISWISPGIAVWDNDPFDKSTATMKRYIDFAANHHIQYLMTDVGWAQKNKQKPTSGVHPDQWQEILPEMVWAPVEDLMHPLPQIDLPEVLSYAKQRNVKVLLWIHWTSARDQMQQVFPHYGSMGLAGFKVDFMGDVPDDQTIVKFYRDLTELAAQNHLVIDFHGAYKPTGLRRTYPNLITREAVMGLEYDSVSRDADPVHEVTLPFTRMLAGPMDFTPGCFNNATREQFVPGKGMCQGTRARQLALYVVFFSPLQMIDASLTELQDAKGLEFIQQVPGVWDETKVLSGNPGQYILIARRRGDKWYIGGLTNWEARDVDVHLDFLGSSAYTLNLYSDGDAADKNAKDLKVETKQLTRTSHLAIHMAPGGGFAGVFVPTGP